MFRPWWARLPFLPVWFAISNQPNGSVPITMLEMILILAMMFVVLMIMIIFHEFLHQFVSDEDKYVDASKAEYVLWSMEIIYI